MKLCLLLLALCAAVLAEDKCGCCPEPCCCTCVTTEDVPGVECPTTTSTTSTTSTTTTTTSTTTTTTTTEFIPQCNSTLDVSFVVDSSGSVGENWPVALQFVRDVIGTFTRVGEDGARFSMITYDRNVSLNFDFCDPRTNQGQQVLLDAINEKDIPLLGTITNTPGALEVAANDVFRPPCDRPDTPNVLIVITDGRTNVRKRELPDIAEDLQNKVGCVIAIGVTDQVNKTELEVIANCNGESKVFEVENFNKLRDELNELIFTVCEDIPTQAPKPAKTTTVKTTKATTPRPPKPTLAPCTPSPPSFKEECFCCCPPPSGYGPMHSKCGC